MQKDLGDIFIRYAKKIGNNLLISVSEVRISPDLSIAHIYLSIFPDNREQELMNKITDDTGYVIINGSIQPDKLRSKPIGKRKEDSYEHFRGIPFLRKKNSFTLTGYMTNNNSYSTVDLYKQTSHK